MRPALFLPLLLSIPGCFHSRTGSGTAALAIATVGPAGGEINITSGDYAGLRLQIPAGAVATLTELRIVDELQEYFDGALPLQFAVPIGLPFRIEPADLRFDLQATLQLPYRVAYVSGTAPGNVRARQVRNGNVIDWAPSQVDVGGGQAVLRTSTLGSFRVVQGPVVADVHDYQQLLGTSVALGGGFAFAVEEVPSTSPFATVDARRWRITGPGFEDVIYFVGNAVRARESGLENWRESWVDLLPVWSYGPLSLPPGTFATPTFVSQPLGGPTIGGAMTASGGWSWSDPRLVGTTLLYDVLQLRLDLAWNRQDLGIGQRSYRFYFAPGHGLIGFSKDGVAHDRASL